MDFPKDYEHLRDLILKVAAYDMQELYIYVCLFSGNGKELQDLTKVTVTGLTDI